MDQFNDFKHEESHPAGEALHSISTKSLDLIPSADTVSSTSLSLGLTQGSSESVESEKALLIDQESQGLQSLDVKHQIEQVLRELLPYIASHGGHVELVEVKETIVFIKFSGACVQCPLSFYTVTYGIERHIKVKIPWITCVEVVENENF